MFAADLPPSMPICTLAEVVEQRLLTAPPACYGVARGGEVYQFLAAHPSPRAWSSGVWIEATVFYTEAAVICDIVLRADAPVLVITEPDEALA